MAATVALLPRWQFFTNAGAPVASGSLYTYAAGTTNALATYSNTGLSVPNANPIPLNSAGRPCVSTLDETEVGVYCSAASYKWVLKDATGTTLWTQDNVFAPMPAILPFTYAIGDLLYANTTSTLAGLADVAAGSVLASGGTNAAPAYTANPSVSTVTTSGNYIFSGNGLIRRNTSDAADSGSIEVNGGGATGSSRGGGLAVYGNEHASKPGYWEAQIGNVASAHGIVRRADGTAAVDVLGSDGSTTFTSSAEAAQVLNSTAANGGVLDIKKAGTSLLQVGSVKATAAAGAGVLGDGVVYATGGKLVLSAFTDIVSNTIYNATSGSAANVFIDSDYKFWRSTSSGRYKRNIEPYRDWRWLLDLTPQLSERTDAAAGRQYVSFLAEDVVAIGPADKTGHPIFADLDTKGRPDSVGYAHFVIPLTAAMQAHEAQLADLAARVKAMEAGAAPPAQ